MRMHNPLHPGEVLRDYLGKLSVTDAAKLLGVTRAALSRIHNSSAGISAEMALRIRGPRHQSRIVDRDASSVRLVADSETAPRQSATFGSGSKSIRVTSGRWSLYREASGTGINTQVFDAAYPPFWPPRL